STSEAGGSDGARGLVSSSGSTRATPDGAGGTVSTVSGSGMRRTWVCTSMSPEMTSRTGGPASTSAADSGLGGGPILVWPVTAGAGPIWVSPVIAGAGPIWVSPVIAGAGPTWVSPVTAGAMPSGSSSVTGST